MIELDCKNSIIHPMFSNQIQKEEAIVIRLAHLWEIYITMSTITSVCPYGSVDARPSAPAHFQFLQTYYKSTQREVAWYVLRVKNMPSWSLSDPWPWDP